MKAIVPLVALMVCVAGCESSQSPSSPCTFSVSPSSRSFGAVGGTGSVTVSAASHCAWTARADVSWLSIAGPATGSGPGVVNFTVEPNSNAAARSGTLVVAGQGIAIAQEGVAGCEYTVTPVEMSVCGHWTDGAISITTRTGCPWTASTEASWITLVSSPVGGGSDTLRFSMTTNYLAPRASVIKIRWPTPTEGQNVQVSQGGCMYAVPSSLYFGSAGGTGSFMVVQQSIPDYTCGGPFQEECCWTARADVPWITITCYMPRCGDNPACFTIAPNDGSSPRTGTITVGDKVVQIVQAGR